MCQQKENNGVIFKKKKFIHKNVNCKGMWFGDVSRYITKLNQTGITFESMQFFICGVKSIKGIAFMKSTSKFYLVVFGFDVKVWSNLLNGYSTFSPCCCNIWNATV